MVIYQSTPIARNYKMYKINKGGKSKTKWAKNIYVWKDNSFTVMWKKY